MEKPAMKTTAVLVLAACAAGAAADGSFLTSGFIGREQYPQFRGIVGLPGSGFAVSPDGRLDFSGAMAYSTPVAFTPGGARVILGVGVYSYDREIQWLRSGKDATTGNGTGFISFGFDLPQAGQGMLGFASLSGGRDMTINLQYTPRQSGKVKVAVGALDFSGVGGSSGTGIQDDDDSSQSFYVVATGPLQEGVYASLGTGTRRYTGLFGNLSGNINRNFKGVVEYDGFNWNYGIAFNPGPFVKSDPFRDLPVRSPELTMFLGMVRGNRPAWSVVLSF